MNVLLGLIEDHYRANAYLIKKEMELRHGIIVSQDNQLRVQVFAVKEIDYALIKLGETDVMFVTVDWEDPSVKFHYL